MRARGAFFVGPGQLEVRDFEIPDPGPSDVALRVAACGVCGSDLHQLHGRWSPPEVVPGHEVGAVVEDTGDDVTGLEQGDRVILEPIVRCGECRFCLTGRYLHCTNGTYISVGTNGGFADRMCVPAYCCHKVTGDLEPAVGAFGEPLSVALHSVRIAPPTGEDTVLILGAGTIGLMTVAAARALGAGRILVTGKYDHQADAARSLGADEVLPPGEDLADRVSELCPLGPDVVIETVGTVGEVQEQALRIVRSLGTVVLVGGVTDAYPIHLGPIIHKELTVLGSPCYGQIGVRKDFEIAADLLSSGAIDVSSLATARFSLDEIQEAFAAAEDKQAGAIKVLVTPNKA